MASIEERTTGTGTVWRVRFRRDGANKAVTFTDPERAETWRRLVEHDAPAALGLLERMRDSEWSEAQAKARETGDDLVEVIRRALREYVES